MQKATDTAPQSTVDSSSVFEKAESLYSKGRKYTIFLSVSSNQGLMNSSGTF